MSLRFASFAKSRDNPEDEQRGVDNVAFECYKGVGSQTDRGVALNDGGGINEFIFRKNSWL